MKSREKNKAIELRKQGYSIKKITQKVGASKSSVSLWVRDVPLSKKQNEQLRANKYSNSAVEKRRQTRLKNERARKQKVIDKAYREIEKISNKDLFFIGLSLYLGEGSKKKPGVLEFANSDPVLILIMKRFFEEICKAPSEKIRVHIHLHPHLCRTSAENYWSNQLNIPLSQFFKTTQQHNKSSKNKKDNLPYGTVSIYVCDINLQLKVQGWMEALQQKTVK